MCTVQKKGRKLVLLRLSLKYGFRSAEFAELLKCGKEHTLLNRLKRGCGMFFQVLKHPSGRGLGKFL
jgi:hypothetical protein